METCLFHMYVLGLTAKISVSLFDLQFSIVVPSVLLYHISVLL